MVLEDRATGNRERQLLTECPLSSCQADLSGKTKTSDHFWTEHRPEDFGLTPLGEIREGTATPLFRSNLPASGQSDQQLLADGGQQTGGDARVE